MKRRTMRSLEFLACSAAAVMLSASPVSYVCAEEESRQEPEPMTEQETGAESDDLPETAETVEEKEAPSEPLASVTSGFYTEDIDVELSLPESLNGKGRILYTMNCSTPEEGNSVTKEYTEPIHLAAVTTNTQYVAPKIIRAVCVDEAGNVSSVATYTYFVGTNMDREQTIPVASLVTDSANLYDSETGLFKHTGESGSDWERPATFCWFSTDGTEQINMDIGIRLHGGATRDFNLKSFGLFARSIYDEQKTFDYAFFEDSTLLPAVTSNGAEETIDRFKTLILRDGGNEGQSWDSTMMRDALIQGLMADTNLDLQAYQPVVVYLNGAYYGLMNLRERYDQDYLAEHYNCNKEDVVLYGYWYQGKTMNTYVDHGDGDEIEWLDEFYDFVRNNDLSDPDNYAYVEERLDIDDYIDYMCLEIYSGNCDWPGNNVRSWRYTGEAQKAYGLDGKLRFLVYDTDFGLGLYGRSASEDYFANATKEGSTEWPNYDESTLLLRKLLENATFTEQFETRYMDLMNTNLSYSHVSSLADTAKDQISPYFTESKNKYWYDDLSKNISSVKNFAKTRGSYAFREMQNHLGLGDKYSIAVDLEGVEGLQSIDINTLHGITTEYEYLDGETFQGDYAVNVPVTLTAHAAEGYRFTGWTVEYSSRVAESEEETTVTESEEETGSQVETQSDGQEAGQAETLSESQTESQPEEADVDHTVTISDAQAKETVTLVPCFEAIPEEPETEEETTAVVTIDPEQQETANTHHFTIVMIILAFVAVIGVGTVLGISNRKK